MSKKKTEIAVNLSSGAEKVEEIEKIETKKTPQKKTTVTQKKKTQQTSAKGESALGSEQENLKKTEEQKGADKEIRKITAKKINSDSANKRAERESRMAKARVERAIAKKEMEEKRKQARAEKVRKKEEERKKRAEMRKAQIEKRRAEIREIQAKLEKYRKEKAEKRAAAKEEKRRARAHAKAAKNQNRSKKKKETEGRRTKERRDGEKRNKGYGGWIAAVVSLGVVTLALATTVTVGAIDMRDTQNALLTGYRGTVYELTGIMDNVDEDLDRVRISASPAQQSRILTDLLVQTRLAELDLEKLPVSAESDRNVTSFINRAAMECEKMLAKLRHGEPLSEKDFQTLEGLYNANKEIRKQMDDLAGKMTEKDMRCLIKDGTGAIADTLKGIEEKTLPENVLSFDKKMQDADGAGTKKILPSMEQGEKIDPVKAETLCAEYFSEYTVKEFQCVGETVSPIYAAYNVQGYDDKGTLLFAEISQKDGKLLRFDYYEEGDAETFDFKNAQRIAEEFLDKLGYADMEVVRLRENGSMADFTFVYEKDGVIYYPDEIRVKICRTRGVVTGFDATKYLRNHKDRVQPNVQITLAQASEKIHEKLAVESVRLAVVKGVGGERTAYEFFCSYGEENYFVYLDAASGEELSIVNAKKI